MFRILDEKGDDDGRDGAAKGEDLSDVTRGGNGFELNDLEIGIEIRLNGEIECHCFSLEYWTSS